MLGDDPAWLDDVDLHPEDVGKRIYADETGRTFILDDPLPVREPRASHAHVHVVSPGMLSLCVPV